MGDPLPSRPPRELGALRATAVAFKNRLRRYLIKTFPVAYDIVFTSGNMDETPWAVIAGHREFVQLMEQSSLRDLLACYPPLVFRPYRRYLATSFTKKDRRTILKNHYSYLLACIGERFFQEISRSKILLWQKTVEEYSYTIKLSFVGELQHEGDLMLEFEENSVRLYHMSFTISPGSFAGCSAAQVVLIGHVLGIAGNFEAIRRATKACQDIAPSYLLMAAIQGIAGALNIDLIAAVRNKEQITANSNDSEAVYFDYDAFWRTQSGSEQERFYLIPVPIPEKPLALISASHRRRTRLKRQFKSGVADEVKARIGSFLKAN